jgi:DNA-binding transcriptional MerR regulator
MSKRLGKNFKKVQDAFPELDITPCDAFHVGAKVLVTEKFLSQFYNVTDRTIRLWKEKGLKVDPITVHNLNLFNLVDAIQWQLDNVDSKKSSIIKTDNKPTYEDELSLDLSKVSKEEADRRLQIQKVLNEEIKHKELTGKLIPAEDTDKALAELGAVHVAQYRGDLKLLPMLLENKPKHEISKLLDEHYKTRVEDMHKLVNVKNHTVTIYEGSLKNGE